MKAAKRPRIVILGGGYAALAAASTLASQCRDSQVTVIAPRKAHIKITRLHETLRYSLRHLCVLYAELEKRFGFSFIHAKLRFDTDSLLRWQHTGTLRFEAEEIRFDYLIIATGANYLSPEKTARVLTVSDFCINHGQTLIRDSCERKGGQIEISIIGGGATGIQFLFELSNYLHQRACRPWKLRLVDYEPLILGQFPKRFQIYTCDRMTHEGVQYIPNTAFIRQEDETIVLSSRDAGGEFHLPSNLTLLFLGVRPNPFPIKVNCFGQVIANGEALDRIFAAGDCAHFAGAGANTLSAQVAIRKGKTVAGNILSLNRSGQMQAYEYAEQGYFVSLGPMDGIGWLNSKENIVTGLAASTVRTAIEKQYDLLMAGVDTYTI